MISEAGDPAVPAALMALAGGHGRLLWHKSKPWASATFAGSRDEVAFEYMGRDAVAAGEAMLDALSDAEIQLKGREVVDAVIGWRTRLWRPDVRVVAVIELLLLEES